MRNPPENDRKALLAFLEFRKSEADDSVLLLDELLLHLERFCEDGGPWGKMLYRHGGWKSHYDKTSMSFRVFNGNEPLLNARRVERLEIGECFSKTLWSQIGDSEVPWLNNSHYWSHGWVLPLEATTIFDKTLAFPPLLRVKGSLERQSKRIENALENLPGSFDGVLEMVKFFVKAIK